MSHYTINSIPLSDYSIIAGRASDSNLAISGAWDMPARTGKIYHSWPDENGIEPYLRADELFYGGRTITFHGYVKGTSRSDAMGKVQAFYDELDLLSGSLFSLSCNWGTWSVQVLEPVVSDYLKSGICMVEIPFREPVVDMAGVIPVSTDAPIGIDGISFSDLGLVKQLTENNFRRPTAKMSENTAYGYEKVSVVKRGLREFSIRFFIKQPSYTAFVGVIQSLMALLSSPFARTLRLDDGTVREVFNKDGFTVSGVRKNGNMVYAFVDIPFAEIRLLEVFNLLTTNTGNILVDKHGRELTEIIKGF